MDNLNRELAEIGSLITSTMFLAAIRKEVANVRRDGFIVTDGKRAGASEYDVVVRSLSGSEEIARRIRDKVEGARVERIAEGVLGVKEARRGSSAYVRFEAGNG